jgi:DNA ligase-1
LQLEHLVTTSLQVARTGSRLEKIDLLATLLARVPPEDIDTATALLSGSLPAGRVGVGYAAMRDATLPDPPDTPTLTLDDVRRTFETIARAAGKGSAGARREALREMLSRATADEREFLLRLVVGELRQGALEGLMVEAIARARSIPAERVRRALLTVGDLRAVARSALVDGQAGLDRFTVQLLRPLQPMLAQPASDIGDAIEQFGETALEYKLDGARVQIHKAGDIVKVFSRPRRAGSSRRRSHAATRG